MQDEQKKPTKTFRLGAIRASIWANSRVIDNAVVLVHSIRIDKSYRQGEQWKETRSFVAEDLPKVAIVAADAYRYLRLRTSDDEPARVEDVSVPDDPGSDE
jgi:hypothetical protein